MAASDARRRFFNYPQPIKGPITPYNIDRKSNPVLTGYALVVCAFLVSWLGVLRSYVWANAGFGGLRKIRADLEDYEPWYNPKVVPRPETDAAAVDATALLLKQLPATRQDACFYSVADYRALYLSGELTPTDIARALLPIIRRDVARPGPHSIAWLDVKVDLVMKMAEASTLRYRKKQSLGPLDGVPTAIKDDTDMEYYTTTLGSVNDYTIKATEDGSITNWCVRKLDEAGALILGKLIMNEFGMGNNPDLGTPPNPFHPGYYPGGSSTGPGYAVGTGLIPIALGSDGGGSVRVPASFCSVFGLKTTHGRLTSLPGANHSKTCGVMGPLAADMHSLAAMYRVLAAPHPSTDFPDLVLEPQLSPPTKVLGICEEWFARAVPGVQGLVRSLVDKLVATHGYRVVSIDMPFLAEGQNSHAMTILTDAATLLAEKSNITDANKVLVGLGRVTPSTDYLLAQKLRGLLMQHLSHLWSTHPGMMILTPTTACAGWPVLGGETELKFGLCDGDTTKESMAYVWLANFCGMPSLTVPAGYLLPEGVPGAGGVAAADVQEKVAVGLMVTGEWCSEEALLQFGVDAEEVAADRRCRPSIWEDVILRAKAEAKGHLEGP